MPIFIYIRNQSYKGALLIYKENSIFNIVNIKAEVLINLYIEVEKVPKNTSITNNIK